jgi:sulfonate transport system permease protein
LGDRQRALTRAALAWLVPLCLLAAWSVASGRQLIAPQILPPPALVKDTLLDLARSGDLLRHGAVSLARVGAGFLLGSVLGVALGTAMGVSRRFEQYVAPLWSAFTQVPVLGWIPLLMMVLGIGEALKVVLLMLAVVVPLAVNTASGIRAVPAAYVEVARALRFSRLQLLRRVVVPAALPAVFTGARHGLTQAWLALVTVELLASSEGLGFMIVWGRQLFQLDLVLAAIVLVGLVGLLFDRGLAVVEGRLMPWRREATP